MIVVCDMGPLQYLILIDCVWVLPHLFDRVLTPRVVVEKEMQDPSTPESVRAWAVNPPSWLEIKIPNQIEAISTLGKEGVRGDGDRAVIALAIEQGADLVLMDDMKARKEARKRGVEPVWMLEILDEAAERGFIGDLAARLEILENQTPFYVGEKARVALSEMKRRYSLRTGRGATE